MIQATLVSVPGSLCIASGLPFIHSSFSSSFTLKASRFRNYKLCSCQNGMWKFISHQHNSGRSCRGCQRCDRRPFTR